MRDVGIDRPRCGGISVECPSTEYNAIHYLASPPTEFCRTTCPKETYFTRLPAARPPSEPPEQGAGAGLWRVGGEALALLVSSVSGSPTTDSPPTTDKLDYVRFVGHAVFFYRSNGARYEAFFNQRAARFYSARRRVPSMRKPAECASMDDGQSTRRTGRDDGPIGVT